MQVCFAVAALLLLLTLYVSNLYPGSTLLVCSVVCICIVEAQAAAIVQVFRRQSLSPPGITSPLPGNARRLSEGNGVTRRQAQAPRRSTVFTR